MNIRLILPTFILSICISGCTKSTVSANQFVDIEAAPGALNVYIPSQGTSTTGHFYMVLPYSVTAKNDTIYISSGFGMETQGTINAPIVHPNVFGVEFSIDNGVQLVPPGAQTNQVNCDVISDDGIPVDSNYNFRVLPNQTRIFKLEITFNPTITTSYRAQLDAVAWSNNEVKGFSGTVTSFDTLYSRTSYTVGP